MPLAHSALQLVLLLLALSALPSSLAQQNSTSNSTYLPDLPPGVFNASARIEINGSIDTVWNVLLDFPSYPDWNPFVRNQTVADALGIPLADQTPEVNDRLWIEVQIPPLPLPVNASTPSNPLNSQTSFENITDLDTPSTNPDFDTKRRVAWQSIFLPEVLLNATHWQALSVISSDDDDEGDVVLYESLEVYYGPVSYVVGALFEEGLNEGFVEQGVALKQRVEGMESEAETRRK